MPCLASYLSTLTCQNINTQNDKLALEARTYRVNIEDNTDTNVRDNGGEDNGVEVEDNDVRNRSRCWNTSSILQVGLPHRCAAVVGSAPYDWCGTVAVTAVRESVTCRPGDQWTSRPCGM